MSFMPEDAPEFEEIRQCHDAWIKRSRLELMAETGHADGARMLTVNAPASNDTPICDTAAASSN
ncbi:MAG: hypothetical protein C4338_06380 [Rhodanobacteraceae bacterium]